MKSEDLFRQNFPDALRRQLESKGWSQRHFAINVMNVSPQAITGWLNGSRPEPDKIADMATIFDADYQALLATGFFTPSRYRPAVPAIEEPTGDYEVLDENPVPATEFESRHADLLRKYIALPAELKMPIRAMIENATFLLKKAEIAQKTGTDQT